MKKEGKLDELTKAKLIYSGELALFAVLFAVLGSLFLSGVIKPSDWKKWLVLIGGTLGSLWCFIDFIWILNSPKRKAKNCLLDKILLLPSAAASLGFNIFFWIKMIPFNSDHDLLFAYFLGAILLYFSLVYVFEAAYHWKHPIPGLLEEEKTEPTEIEADKKEGE